MCVSAPVFLVKRGSQSTAAPHSTNAPCWPSGCSTVTMAFSCTADLLRESASLRQADNQPQSESYTSHLQNHNYITYNPPQTTEVQTTEVQTTKGLCLNKYDLWGYYNQICKGLTNMNSNLETWYQIPRCVKISTSVHLYQLVVRDS